ncbi:MAG: ATP-binding protein [Candidatus Thiodiazotropha sp. (ex Rostrolucina anterorostrata)]|nr:ATP-binding protein [Candidatus Thiodiazotropha sp. (ex Rostrolucina anterorostrata)]
MAQADLLVDLFKSASNGDQLAVRRVAENLIKEEKDKGHRILAERLAKAIQPSLSNDTIKRNGTHNSRHKELIYEITPERSLSSLVLTDKINTQIKDVVEEQHRSELLHAHNLRARNRLLFAGPPGNGKTTLAEALAHELMYPLLVVRYETLVGSYLGETAGRLKHLFDFAKTQRCVLFFDEFETLGKERGDSHETGEIKRVVSSLLLQIDDLPDYVVIVAASNHSELLDRAVWRRFQVRLELPLPTRSQLTSLIESVEKRCQINFGYASETLAKQMKGLNFSEVEEFCLSVVRRAVLDQQTENAKIITKIKLEQWHARLKPKIDNSGKDE